VRINPETRHSPYPFEVKSHEHRTANTSTNFWKGRRTSSHGGRTGPRTTILRVSYRESTYARLKEWNQLPMNMAVFLMAVLLYACGHGAACCAALTVDAQILNMISNIELMIVVLILTRVTCGHSQRHAGERTSCPSHTRQS
jgi:MFS-type transporter involved in bile tolerance (Atg22 family)